MANAKEGTVMAEIHKCGQGWVYCGGNCATCAVNNYCTTTSTNIKVTSEKDYPPYLDYPKERKKQTNADKIRQMSDEELAMWLTNNVIPRICEIPLSAGAEPMFDKWFDWLKQEVESDG